MGTTPVGPLSLFFLDLRRTSTLGKKHPYRNPWYGPPPSSARVPGLSGVNGPTILDCQVVVYRVGILDHFSMATPNPPHRAPSSVWFYNHFSPPLCDPGVLDHPSMGPSLPPSSVSWTRGPPHPFGGPRVGNALTAAEGRPA